MDPEAIRDVFQALGPVRIRRMFGGQGIYRDDVMFALEAGGELYLKTDEETLPIFKELDSRPFSYQSRDGRTTIMSYWLMPEGALEDEAEARRLGILALEAARRAKTAKPSRSRAKVRAR